MCEVGQPIDVWSLLPASYWLSLVTSIKYHEVNLGTWCISHTFIFPVTLHPPMEPHYLPGRLSASQSIAKCAVWLYTQHGGNIQRNIKDYIFVFLVCWYYACTYFIFLYLYKTFSINGHSSFLISLLQQRFIVCVKWGVSFIKTHPERTRPVHSYFIGVNYLFYFYLFSS